MVLPGMINMSSASIASRLLAGLMADRNAAPQGGGWLHSRVLPMLTLSQKMLDRDQLSAIALTGLWEGVSGGTTTAVELCLPEFIPLVQDAGEQLGLPLYPSAVRYDYPRGCTAEDMVRENRAAGGLKALYAAFSSQEDRTITTLSDLGFLGPGTTLCQCVLADKGERELMAYTGTAAAISALGCAQEGKQYPGVDFLRCGVNTPLGTGNYGNCMIAEMRTAALAAKQAEADPGRYKANDALYAATVAGARALGRNGELGRIEIGMAGNVSVVDLSRFQPLSYPFIQYLYGASAADVRHVAISGKALKKDFKPSPDIAEILEQSKAKAIKGIKTLWEEAIRSIL
jgi:5-methylthioadenosine/S-adenosylhomocysteine deaminase